MSFKLTTQRIVLIVAVILAAAAVIFYLLSGQSSLDANTRALKNSDQNVAQVSINNESQGQKNIEVKCQDGSSYDVYIPPGQTNYDALAASKCQK